MAELLAECSSSAYLTDTKLSGFKPIPRKPMWLNRMDWQEHPVLVKRRAVPPQPVTPLPPIAPLDLSAERANLLNHHEATTSSAADDTDELINPGDFE